MVRADDLGVGAVILTRCPWTQHGRRSGGCDPVRVRRHGRAPCPPDHAAVVAHPRVEELRTDQLPLEPVGELLLVGRDPGNGRPLAMHDTSQ